MLQFERCDDEQRQFYQRYQFPHSLLIERRFEVLMLQIRGYTVKHWILPQTCHQRWLPRLLIQSNARVRRKRQDNDLLVASMFKRQWCLSSSLQSAGVKGLKTIGSRGMTHAGGEQNKKVSDIHSLNMHFKIENIYFFFGNNNYFSKADPPFNPLLSIQGRK